MSFIDKLGPTVLRDLAYLMCGRRLGAGIARKVYVFRPDPTKVIKIESRGSSFQNINEWNLWEAVEHNKERARWLAPCRFISACGAVLIQDRTEPIRTGELPKRIPEFVRQDVKLENWGILNGRPVCHDYAFHSDTLPLKMVEADWR